ncbi:MAG: RagB/SusD family nutrient uptake outer membrane protein [Filimonas sp.]|nr:RagB/SusD family nutrient uptake outer membrane protein [Filimonas sp.]
MKQIINIKNSLLSALICLLVLTFTACRKQLDRDPLTAYTGTNVWTSKDGAMLALTAVYRGNITFISTDAEYTPSDWWSYMGLISLEFATDNAYDRRGDNSVYNLMTSGGMVATNANLGYYWSLSYQRIARANFFLENVGQTPVDQATLNRWKAEARFLRATQYFYLSQYFGSVPLVTKTLTTEQANTVRKTSRDSVIIYAETEFAAAANDLPRYKDLPAAERGRATKQVALAFLGRLQLANKEYTAAAATFKSIIDFGDNIIDPKFSSLFDGTNENSKEIIFATQFVIDKASNPMALHYFPAKWGGYHLFNPLGNLVENFEFTDGTTFSYTDARYNAANLQQNRDPRLGYTVLYNGQTFAGLTYVCHPDSTTSPDQLTTTRQATRTGYCMRKFLSPQQYGGSLANSGVDIPIVRYAEVLLSYLEANLEAGSTISQSLLDQTINAVRGRADVQMPKVTETDPAKLRVILRRERRNELAFEGLRYWDLLRWGTAAQVLSGDFYGAPFPGAKNLRKAPSGAIDPFSRWYVTTKNFSAGNNQPFWPIPQSEVNLNPNLGK